MATVTLPQPPVAIVDIWPVDLASMPRASGPEGAEVLRMARFATRYWFDRGERVINGRHAADDFSYQPVPPKRISHVQVRYIDQGRGKPLPLTWDWDD
jgi:hypothetical protein